MAWMFFESQAIELDLSSFDTSNVIDMDGIFAGAEATTIYVGNKWNTANIPEGASLFSDNVNLVGENGTRYSNVHTDKTYARVDKSGIPGYFTLKTN